jgi:cyclase
MGFRVIPRLDIKGPNLVKGINFEGLRVLGKPEKYARHYYRAGADELFYQDAVASLYGRNSLLDIVGRTAREIFIPLTVGGGLRTLDDIRAVLRAGADKVAINTAALQRPELIAEASRSFGSSTIVVSIEAIRLGEGKYEAYTDYGRESTGVDALQWAARAVDLGAGELMVTSIDREGTGRGLDLELTRAVARAVPVPVIAGGGAGRIGHAVEAAREGSADAICLASLLHYDLARRLLRDEDDFSIEGNVEFLRGGQLHTRIKAADLPGVKRALGEAGVECRPISREPGP